MKHLCNLLIVLSFIVTLFNPTVGYAKTEVKSIFTDITGGIDKSDRSIRYLQARVKFNNMVIDGLLFGSPSIRFKISQPPGRNISYALILSSGNSLLNINKNNNKNGGYGNNGYKYWIRSGENITLRTVSNDFSSRQIKALKSMCGFLSDPNNMKKNIINLLETKSRRMDPSVKRIFTVRTNIEFSKLALNCKNAIDRKIIGYETLSKRQAPKLCGVETRGFLLNSRTFKSIQSDLKLLGYYNGKVDGLFGAGSCKSLAAYNSSIGKTVTTYYTNFYINSLREKAKSVSTVIPQKSKETESEAAILAAAKKEAAEIIEAAKKEAAILEAAKKEAAEIVEAAKKEAAILEAAKKEAAEIVEAAKKEADENNELSASNILLADNISDEAALSPSTVIVEEKELKENIFQIEKLTELQEIVLKADTFLMEYNKDQAGKLMRYKLRLTVKGSEIDTSLVSKSIFGFENSSSIDISMSIGSSQAALDFIIDEENTKINLHFSDEASVNKDFASNIPELILDASEISGAFLVRIIDDGSNNIQSGDFAQILERLDPKDVALVGAFCSVVQSISVDKNTFIKSVTQNIPDESKDGFSSSPLVSDGVINIINSHATACVGELEKINNTKASFDIPNLFDFEQTGETLLENSSENILEKSRAELKIKEIAEQKRLAKQYAEEKRLAEEQRKKDKQRRLEEKRIADLAKVEKQKQLEKEKKMAESQNLEKLLDSVGIKCTDSATTQFIGSSAQKQVNGIISRAIKSTHKIGWLSKEKFIKSCSLSGVAMIVEFNTGNRLGYDWNNSFTGYKFISKKEWDNWPPAATCYEIKTRKVFKSDLYCGVKY
ncbi:hypothetical protein N9I17_04210 [Amylibacter sp.]|nr:hypothetical protein [Amylibacter sp.]